MSVRKWACPDWAWGQSLSVVLAPSGCAVIRLDALCVCVCGQSWLIKTVM